VAFAFGEAYLHKIKDRETLSRSYSNLNKKWVVMRD
jgi:hypothetical protein